MTDLPDFSNPWMKEHSRFLYVTYLHWMKLPLLKLKNPEKLAEELFDAPFALLSSGPEADPFLQYGNKTALGLWELSWDELCQTKGRQTAESMHQDKRRLFLEAVKKNGYVDNYEGVRIAKTGRRFKIQKATVWNLIDPHGKYCGQAAVIRHWTYL